MQYAIEMETAKKALRLAATLTSHVQNKLKTSDVLEKDDRSPVTKADFGAQALVNYTLATSFPMDKIVAEEKAAELVKAENRALLESILEALSEASQPMTEKALLAAIDHGIPETPLPRRYWTLDPIDGTKGFLRGDHYALALALIEDGEVKMGALACPNMPSPSGKKGLLCLASQNQPTIFLSLFEDEPGQEAKEPGNLPMKEAKVCESVESGHTSHSRSQAISLSLGIEAEPFRIDSQCKYAAVALGLANIYLRLPSLKGYEEKIWDHAAGKFIVERAHGTVTDTLGRPLDFSKGPTLSANKGVVASKSIDHAALLKAVMASQD